MVGKLAVEGAPKVIARLPFVERPDHPAGMPVFIISNPLAEAAARDVALFWVAWRGAVAPDDAHFRNLSCECQARATIDGGVSLLLSAPGDWSAEKLAAGIGLPPGGAAAWIGSHAERFALA